VAGSLAFGAGSGAAAGAPSGRWACRLNVNGYFAGAYGSAAAMGWPGNQQGVVGCLGGSFLVQDGLYRSYGFGLYTGTPTRWSDADGWLPALITAFSRGPSRVTITEFADRVVLSGQPYVLAYARVAVHNTSTRPVTADPAPSPGLVPLNTASDTVGPHVTAVHDYVVAADRFGSDAPWPAAAALAGAGGFETHYLHMAAFWRSQVAGIAQVQTPDRALDDAYLAGYVATEIARSGDQLHTGVNGYQAEYSHDVIGILATLFTQGAFQDAHALLLEARSVMGGSGQYVDGLWTYPWPWAVYLLKTGDLAFVRANFATEGPGGAATPSIMDAAHAIAADRTGPGGTMEATDDIDTQGYWTLDDYEALLGLAAYRYVAGRLGDTAEATWAATEYNDLLAATNRELSATIARGHLAYLPCALLQPNTANRCRNPKDANWTSPLAGGQWSWEAGLFGAPRSGPGLTLLDATYRYGFGRLKGLLPPDTAGGFPTDWYSTAYNAGMGAAGLAGTRYRDQGIMAFQFMLARTQSGPNSWWESAGPPDPKNPWVGSHPARGQGSAPHAWGMAQADRVLLDSIVAQRSDGSLVVGRGLPDSWLANGHAVAVTGFPTASGGRLAVRITTEDARVTVSWSGDRPAGPVLLELPAFRSALVSTTAGRISRSAGTVTVPAGVGRVTVTLSRAPAA
jgi:hypothetical protein